MADQSAADADAQPDPALTILLVEDNHGDARYIQEIFREAGELSVRAAGEPGAAKPTIVHVSRLDEGLERLGEDIDTVLLDLNLPDSEGLDTVEAVSDHASSVPIVVLTGVRDRRMGLDALEYGAEEYLVKDEITADLLVRSVYHAIERQAQAAELERQRDQLETLNALSELVHEITHLVIESSTREAIEELVCERLAEAAPYEFAWIGEVDRHDEEVVLRTEVGVENFLDGISIRVDDRDDAAGPTARALRTGAVEVVGNLPEGPAPEPWQTHAARHGFRSAAAIPITYEETVYGVLNVFSMRPDAFDTDERAVISRLGEVVGHAINAIERKEALMGEDVVEVRFLVDNVGDAFDVDAAFDGRITFDRVVPVDDGVFVEYGTVTADAVDTLEALVDALPHYDSVSVYDPDAESSRFELRLTEPPVISAIASYGGRVASAVIEDGDYRLVVEVPTGVDVSRVVEAVKGDYPEADVVAQRHTTRPSSTARADAALLTDLTDKQRAALESAYFAGFFEWPRVSSGEDVADSLDVSPSTFHQHVRMAERKLLATLLEDDTDGRSETS